MSHNEDKLIRQHMGLVRSQALRMLARLPASVSLDDLMQAGLIGLLDSIRRYTEQPDAKFETYAISCIRGAMLDELRRQDWLSRSIRHKARQIEEAIHRLRQTQGREPTEHELAQALDVSLPEYHKMLYEAGGTQVVHMADLYRHSTEDQDVFLEVNAQPSASVSHALRQPHELLATQELRQCLIEAIKNLPEREQLLLSLQFEHDLNQKEIAAVMEVSEGRISQLRSQAISRIRAYLRAHHWEQRPEEFDIETLF